VQKSCRAFVEAYASKYTNCFNCLYWHMDDFVCLNSEEIKRRRVETEFDSIDRIMRSNTPIVGPL